VFADGDVDDAVPEHFITKLRSGGGPIQIGDSVTITWATRYRYDEAGQLTANHPAVITAGPTKNKGVLRSVNMCSNGLRSEAMASLAEVLTTNTSLIELNVTGNALVLNSHGKPDATGFNLFTHAVSNHLSLAKLHIGMNDPRFPLGDQSQSLMQGFSTIARSKANMSILCQGLDVSEQARASVASVELLKVDHGVVTATNPKSELLVAAMAAAATAALLSVWLLVRRGRLE
jgi:hypothetical protein